MNTAFATIKAQELVFSTLDQIRTSASREAYVKHADILAAWAAFDLLEHQYVDPPSLADLCRKVGTNRTKLQQVFRQVHGVTIGATIEHLRMTKARRLLLETEMSVSQVAFEVGYAQHSSFSSRFKACFGASPRELRNGGQNGLSR